MVMRLNAMRDGDDKLDLASVLPMTRIRACMQAAGIGRIDADAMTALLNFGEDVVFNILYAAYVVMSYAGRKTLMLSDVIYAHEHVTGDTLYYSGVGESYVTRKNKAAKGKREATVKGIEYAQQNSNHAFFAHATVHKMMKAGLKSLGDCRIAAEATDYMREVMQVLLVAYFQKCAASVHANRRVTITLSDVETVLRLTLGYYTRIGLAGEEDDEDDEDDETFAPGEDDSDEEEDTENEESDTESDTENDTENESDEEYVDGVNEEIQLMEKTTVKQLQAMLGAKGLAKTGLKKVLVQRWLAANKAPVVPAAAPVVPAPVVPAPVPAVVSAVVLAASKMSKKELTDKHNVNQLKDIIRAINLTGKKLLLGGNKPELVDRIFNAMK